MNKHTKIKIVYLVSQSTMTRINYDQDSVKSRGWEFLNEVYKNGILWLSRDRELLERSIMLETDQLLN